jgi:2-polyprenyl-6-methoxyphenol hydroxylase-like FAD-dependent oxidoreductase
VTRNNDPILIVGGGLGGASLALARKGFPVRLIEQAPAFGVAWHYDGFPLSAQKGAAA